MNLKYTQQYILSLRNIIDANPRYIIIETSPNCPYLNNMYTKLENFISHMNYYGDSLLQYVIGIYKRIE